MSRVMNRFSLSLLALFTGSAACIDTSGLVFDRDGANTGGTAGEAGGGGGAGGGTGGAGGAGTGGGERTYRDVVLEDGPLAYWPIDTLENGSRTPDVTGNGHDAYIDNDMGNGSADFEVAGAVATAATLDGASLFVDAPHPFGFGDSSYTLEAWVRVDSATNGGLWKCVPSAGGDGYSTYLTETSVNHKRYQDPANEDMNHTPIVLETFRHVVVTFDAALGEGQMYVDGAPIFLPPRELSLSWTIGGAAFELAAAGTPGVVSIDEVAVYDSPLTQERVAEHHACATSGECD